MYFVFADDAKQNPSRERMGPLVAAGAILVDGEQLRRLEIGLGGLCEDHGFPSMIRLDRSSSGRRDGSFGCEMVSWTENAINSSST